jgi:hypothetical protein
MLFSLHFCLNCLSFFLKNCIFYFMIWDAVCCSVSSIDCWFSCCTFTSLCDPVEYTHSTKHWARCFHCKKSKLISHNDRC